MQSYKIIVDSPSMLTNEEMEKYNISKIFNIVILDGVDYEDGNNLSMDFFNESLEKGIMASTAQPSFGKMVEAYETYSSQYDHILFFTMAEGLSGTYNSAVNAIEVAGVSNVTVINSMSVCGPERYLVFKAIEMIEAGVSHDVLVETLNHLATTSRTYLIPTDLNHLKRGGRINKTVATIGALLKIKPVLKFEEAGRSIGKFGVARTEKKAYEMLLNQMESEIDDINQYQVYLYHAKAEEFADRFKAAILEKYKDIEIPIGVITPSVSAHTGLGCVGVQYIKKA